MPRALSRLYRELEEPIPLPKGRRISWMLATTSPGYRRGRRPELDSIREDRPIVNVLLPTEVSLRLLNCFEKRRSFDLERSLADEVLVPGVVANPLDKTRIECRHS